MDEDYFRARSWIDEGLKKLENGNFTAETVEEEDQQVYIYKQAFFMIYDCDVFCFVFPCHESARLISPVVYWNVEGD